MSLRWLSNCLQWWFDIWCREKHTYSLFSNWTKSVLAGTKWTKKHTHTHTSTTTSTVRSISHGDVCDDIHCSYHWNHLTFYEIFININIFFCIQKIWWWSKIYIVGFLHTVQRWLLISMIYVYRWYDIHSMCVLRDK